MEQVIVIFASDNLEKLFIGKLDHSFSQDYLNKHPIRLKANK